MCSARNFNKWLLVLAALVGVLWAPSASAQCTVSVSGFAFGSYDVFALTNLDSTANLTINCTINTNVRVTMGPSATSGNINSRQLRPAAGPDRLNYNLFINSARTVVWGDGVTGGSAATAVGVRSGVPFVGLMFGRIPAGQDVAAGAYTDQVVISVTP